MKYVVIGAGIWGASTAYYLQKAGAHVTLYDMWEPGNVRSGSGGSSRIIRLVYGQDEIYTRWTAEAYQLWRELLGLQFHEYYQETGALWMVHHHQTAYLDASMPILKKHGYLLEKIDFSTAEKRFKEFDYEGIEHLYYEPQAGLLFANKCCAKIVSLFQEIGGTYKRRYISLNRQGNHLTVEADGKSLTADQFVFACGPWNAKLFPEILAENSYCSKQDTYFFAPPAHLLKTFEAPHMPIWLEYDMDSPMYYGMPHHLGKGIKIAYDERSESFDPDNRDRTISKHRFEAAKAFLAHRFPSLRDATLTSAEICQYENSLDGHFILDRHPQYRHIVILGGSSGHGFKLGPALGKYMAHILVKNATFPSTFSLDRFQKKSLKRSQFDTFSQKK